MKVFHSDDQRREYFRAYYRKRIDSAVSALGGCCSVCGEKDGLQFDHKDPAKKLFSVSELMMCSWKRVVEELALCQLLCKKCHLEKTREEGSLNKNRPHGEAIKSSKLTDDKVREIKMRLSNGGMPRTLAREFGVCRGTIQLIKKEKIWKHVQ